MLLRVALAACLLLVPAWGRAKPSTEPAPRASAGIGAQAAASEAAPEGSGPAADFVGPPEPPEPRWEALDLLGERVGPGEARRLAFRSRDDFTAGLVALRGIAPGPTLCVTAGVHGDELNGVAIARRFLDEADPSGLRGTILVVPIVNAHGFRNGTRYLPDRRDLNRYFPGRPNGSAAARIAHQFFAEVVQQCDALVDLHTGSLNRTNLPQIRADLAEVDNLRIAWGFGAEHVVHRPAMPGTLRRAANDAGIPAVLYEAGEPQRIQPAEIELGVRGLRRLLVSLAMAPRADPLPGEQRVYHATSWVRSDASGIYVPTVALGQRVEPGQKLADVSDLFSSDRAEIVAPRAGRVLGMALGQVVIPGFALFHLGEEAGRAAPSPPDHQAGRAAPGPPDHQAGGPAQESDPDVAAAVPPAAQEPRAAEPDEGDGMRTELADERPE